MEPVRTEDTAAPSGHRSGQDEEEEVAAVAAMPSPTCHPAGDEEEEDKEMAAVVAATVSLGCHPSEKEEEEVAVAMTSPGGPCGRDEDVVAAVTAEAAITSQGCHPGEDEEVTTAVTSLECLPIGDEEEEEVTAAVTATVTATVTSPGVQPGEEEEMTMAVTSPACPPVGDEEEVTAAVTSPACHPGEEEEEEVMAAVTSPACHPGEEEEEEVTAAVTSPACHPGEEEEEEVTAAVTSPACHPGEEEEEEVTAAVTSPACHPGEEEEEVTAAVTAAAATSGPGGRRGADEDVAAAGWRARRKHVFVLSEAGKPIYSRHGNEEALAATMGVMMALVSFIQSGGNAIRAICSEDRTLVFEQRGPLLLVSVSRTRQSAAQLRRELAFVHEQILSLLTRGGIARVFARRRGFDLRRLLAGAEAVLDRLLCGAAADGRLLLGAARCLPLPGGLRRAVSGALRRSAAAARPAPALAVLAARGRLVTAARQRALAEGGRLCASDLHLLLNLLGGGAGAGAGEVWTPVCLPRFNPDGYFYAYAARLGEEEEEEEEEGGVTLILLSTEREGFYAAAACRRQLEDTLRAQGWLAELAAAVRGGAGYGPSRPGAPELRHFLYKPLEGPEEMQQLPQFTSPELEEPYTSEEEQHRLFDLYHYLHSRVHSPHRPLRLLYHVAEKETLLAWVTSKFELYSCFSPLVTKAGAIAVLTKLLRWLKKEEDWLFIRYPAPFTAAPTRPEGPEPEG
ncbi:vacuolar fusion protein MON1 homolog B isoform X3 [Corvus moneduloides]|uniref:vacuolar fusion protein MON1 homolog B isoform X3 n=1 Tax=Corvus moneduloides TaxID=1196302 RepID=UPI001362E26E|nr:vacuolar fusion protein MON1 homolog B isoform X3 [Corvus moneduloides]